MSASTTKQVTVEDARSSPSRSPSPPLPSADPTGESRDEGVESSGTDDDDDEEKEDEWDPSEERLPGEAGQNKGKGKGVDGQNGEKDEGGEQPWQAVWSPEQNAWYFWNTVTGEVTWTNPLDPSTSSTSAEAEVAPPLPTDAPPLPSGPVPAPTSEHYNALAANSTYSTAPHASSSTSAAGGAPDIDPDLAYLLHPSQRGIHQGGDASQTALFNARTGRFTANDYSYTVEHLEEYNRAKRMNSHYFDVDAWEKERADEYAKRKREEEMGISNKQRVTKKDMQRYKRKAAEKKARSQAWLRE